MLLRQGCANVLIFMGETTSMHPVFAATLLLFGSAMSFAHAQSYTFTKSKAPMGGSTIFWANSKTAILSEVTSPSGTSVCTLIQGSTKTVINDPSGTATQCYGVSDTGVVVGYYLISAQSAVGFTYTNGVYKDYLAPESNAAMGGTQLNAISDKGLIAGTYSDAAGYSRAFTLRGTTFRNIPVSGANYVIATGVNDVGQVVLQSFDANNNILANYLVKGSAVTTLSYPGASRTIMHDVNKNGMVVGHFTDSSGAVHGFIYDSASSSYSGAIDAPGSSATLLIGINDEGDVVGATPSPSGNVYFGLKGKPAD